MKSKQSMRWIRELLIVAILSIVSLQSRSDSVSAETRDATAAWFQSTEQALMDAIAKGDKTIWDRVLDENCVYTSEEGQTLSKKELLEQLVGLPPGLTGSIKVEDLTVQELGAVAIVRYTANESEDVFGQKLKTKYRVTDVFRKNEPDWKLVSSHLSVVTADPPPQDVSRENWPELEGVYALMPDGWKLNVTLRDGELWAGRSPDKMKLLIPLAPNVFVRKGLLGELIFVTDKTGKASKIVDYRKFEPLIWTRLEK